MPTAEDFEEQAHRNGITAQLLADAKVCDWAVTALFYSALHGIQSHFARLGTVPGTHRKRESLIQQTPSLEPIEEAYRFLRVYSEDARYDCKSFSQEEFTRVREEHYQPLVSHLHAIRGGS